MIVLLVVALASIAPEVQSVPSSHQLLSGAEHALRVGRLDQAKLMIERAIGEGARGDLLDRTLADLAYALGQYDEALARYESLLKGDPRNQAYLEPAGIAALEIGDVKHASAILTRATSLPNPSWRAWNALGVAADFSFNWQLADQCFEQAARLAPSNSAPVNNHGWSLLSRGDWAAALSALQRAAVIDPTSDRIRNNVEIAEEALAIDLPKRLPGESAAAWASRLNDAGVAAELVGHKQKAIAAFSLALEASDTWYARAANNLAAISAP